MSKHIQLCTRKTLISHKITDRYSDSSLQFQLGRKELYIIGYIRPLKIIGCLCRDTYEKFREVYLKLEERELSTKCKTSVKAFFLKIFGNNGRPNILRNDFVSDLIHQIGREISTVKGLKNFKHLYYTEK